MGGKETTTMDFDIKKVLQIVGLIIEIVNLLL
nr:MAG TPA: hypothetical protein [Caudoviricetes sp.]